MWQSLVDNHRNCCPSQNVLAEATLVPFQGGGTNSHFRLITSHGDFLAKFSRDVQGMTPDQNQREEMACLFGRLLQVPTREAWVVAAKVLPIPSEVLAREREAKKDLRTDQAALVRFLKGTTIADDPVAATQAAKQDWQAVGDLFAFMHWLGDEDRGRGDVIVADGRLTLMDNGVLGPGRSSVIRSAHPHVDEFAKRPDSIVKMCWHRKPSLVCFVLRDAAVPPRAIRRPPVIERILETSDDAIAGIVSAAGLPPWIADILILRREVLPVTYVEWLNSAFLVCGGMV